MEHLFARIRSAKGNEKSKFKKILSGQTVFDLGDEFSSPITYEADHNLDPGTWFGLKNFSDKDYFPEWLKQKEVDTSLTKEFSSSALNQLHASELEKIDYICAYQEENMFCFQKITKRSLLRKKYVTIGDCFSMQTDDALLIINEVPDAVYVRDRDILFFKSLPAITSIFKGIDELYREATDEETTRFLNSAFILLQDGFSTAQVSKPNRHRISMAEETLKSFNKKQKKEIVAYIREYCPDLECQNGQFSVGTDDQLKSLLYGIEQRYYTTILTKEKRLANSVISLGSNNGVAI